MTGLGRGSEDRRRWIALGFISLAQLMVALSRFAADHADQVGEIDLNPVIVHPAGEGLTIVDALIVKK